MDYYKAALELHEQHKGKIEVTAKVPVKTRDDLSAAYTPGVAEPCREIAKDPAAAYTYTAKGNLVAVVTNGTAVLGLGDIGAAAAHAGDGGQSASCLRSSAVWMRSPSAWTHRTRSRSSRPCA